MGVTIGTNTDSDDAEVVPLPSRVGRAWREIRRGASASQVKDLFYGTDDDPDALDMALADALVVLVQKGPLRMGELAEALHITPASATRAASCLVERDYAKREQSTKDQRSYVVSATPEGERVQKIFAARIDDGLAQILSRFDAGEQLQLADLLERFADSVEQLVIDSRSNNAG